MFLKPSPPPVRRALVPGVVRDLIDDAVEPLLYGGKVYTQQERPIAPGVQPPWARVIVMIPRMIAPVSTPMPTREETVAIQVCVEAAEDPEQRGGWDYQEAIDEIHAVIFRTIQGARLDVPLTEVEFPVFWGGWVNTPAERDESEGTWFQSAEYRTVLRGVERAA